MSTYLRNLFGGQGQSSKAQGESRSRSRQAPAVAYNYKSSRSATPESSPSRSAGVKRSHSATRSHAPSPLRDVTNEEAQRPTLQRSSTSRSHSKGKSSNAQYNGPGTGKFHPDKVRLFVNIVPLGPHYQILSPSEPYMYTPTSSRTGSSASLHPGTPSVAFVQPLSRSASHSHTPRMPSRPALKSNNTWAGTGTTSSVGRTCITIFIISRKPDPLPPQIPHPTHDHTLRSTSQPASTCILSLPIHVSITHPSSTT